LGKAKKNNATVTFDDAFLQFCLSGLAVKNSFWTDEILQSIIIAIFESWH